MRNDYIDAKPITFDFGEGFGETWETVPPDLSGLDYKEVCNVIDNLGSDSKAEASECLDGAFGDIDPLRERAVELIDESPDELAPMMNYAYPIGGDAAEMQAKLLDTSLCVVLVHDEPWLALRGGGMDMSWEICEAYIRLGFLPPAHFSELPAMVGRGESDGDRQIVKSCLESLDMLAGWHQRAADRMREQFQS